MRIYNFVTNSKIIKELSKSQYYKTDLGFTATLLDTNGKRVINKEDEFAASYNSFYKTSISKKGQVGLIHIYEDYYINDDVIACYFELEEFIYNYNKNYILDNGIDSYLGHLLKTIDNEYSILKGKKDNSEKVTEIIEQKKGNADILTTNPGMATYDDIMAYMKKQSNRED